MLNYIDIQYPHTTVSPDIAFVMLHGLGADPEEFSDIPEALHLRGMQAHIRFIAPYAPKINVTINQGMAMSAWFDIKHQDVWEQEDQQSIQYNASLIQDLLNYLIQQGTSPNRLFVAGFSQGAALALYLYTTLIQSIAGFAICSGYLPLPHLLSTLPYPHIPILMVHGKEDSVLPFACAEKSFNLLQKHTKQVAFHGLEGVGHAMERQAMQHLYHWLQLHTA